MRIVVLIFLLIFAYDSELFNVYLGEKNVFFIKIVAFLMLLIKAVQNRNRPNKQEEYVIYFLVLIHLYITGVTVSYTGFEGLFWSFKFLIRFFILVFLIKSFEKSDFHIFIKWYRTIALVLAVQSVLLFIFIYFNIPISKTYVERHSSQDLFSSYGVLGFGNSNTGYSFRTQSFFSEATNFAKFLIFPFYSYLNEFFIRRKKYTLLKIGIILLAILTTFSLTAILGIIIGLVLFFIIRKKGAKGLVRYAPILFIVFLGLYKGVTFLIDIGLDKSTSNIILGSFQKGDTSVGIREEYIYGVLNIVNDNPFGVGYFLEPFTTFSFLPLAPTRWILFGGWFGLILILLLHWNFLKGWSRLLECNYYRLFFVVCVTQFIISLIHGTWTEFIYWINFLVLLELAKWKI